MTLTANQDRPFGLHLHDYPHGNDPLLHLTYERTYPPVTEGPIDLWLMRGRTRDPMLSPPMRDSLADLIDCLNQVGEDLTSRNLYALETAVTHEMTVPPRQETEPQGWKFVVNVLAVPIDVIARQMAEFERLQREAKEKAPAKV